MIEIPIEDWVFVLCVLVGGGLLLITVLLDDILGGFLEFLNIDFDLGGVSLMPLMLGFISMFGVGGLFATQILDVHGAQAAVVGAISGAFGFGVVFALFSVFRRSESPPPFSHEDLVGSTASVAVGIPAGRFGSVYIRAEGQTREITATSPVDLAPGTPVTITATAGAGLVVAPTESLVASSG
jgi:membrane protein implicated in regulation of membrane protease activity